MENTKKQRIKCHCLFCGKEWETNFSALTRKKSRWKQSGTSCPSCRARYAKNFGMILGETRDYKTAAKIINADVFKFSSIADSLSQATKENKILYRVLLNCKADFIEFLLDDAKFNESSLLLPKPKNKEFREAM